MLQLQRQRVLPRAPEGGGRLDDLALLRVGVAEVAPGALVAGREAHRHLQLRQRLLDLPELERDETQVAARVRVLRRRPRHLAVGRVRLLEATQLVAHQREQVQGLHVLRRVGQRAQDLAFRLAESLRRDELAGRSEMVHRRLHARLAG